ncbi:MAG TPA: polyphosphate kinase 1, partial [Vicinamibacterales bacterium]|nr:polyphosphate kinase 1 [Vicinamibacterales bacterium]
MDTLNLKLPDYYINRELSQLAFNVRVLQQARDISVPLLERLKFLCISSTNLDEFFEIRVSGLKHRLAVSAAPAGPDNVSSAEVLRTVIEETGKLVTEQYRVLNDELIPALRDAGISFVRRDDWSSAQRLWLEQHFRTEIVPVLSPTTLDPTRPFPRILNKSLNFIASLDGRDAFGRPCHRAIVQAPRSLPRLIPLPSTLEGTGKSDFVFLSSVIHAFVDRLFTGMEINGCYQFRVTRNSDLFVDDEDVDDLMTALEGELFESRYGAAVRLETAHDCPDELATYLLEHFQLTRADLYQVPGPVNLNRLLAVYDLVDLPELKYPPFTPGIPKSLVNTNIFTAIAKQDILLHHPFESFAPVIDFLYRAATDPDVLAIKQTLYRTTPDSPLAESLVSAAKAGKEVTVLIELRARFDEAANIELASKLQEAGAHVVYGVVGYKTHCKMTLVVRRENGRLKRYVHLGTGNYHPRTARAYTDYGLFSANEALGEDVHQVFMQLTSLMRTPPLNLLSQSPFNLHDRLLGFIRRETHNARNGGTGHIIVKINALVEPEVIRALYEASSAGVFVDLIVRGICCLRPGVPGVSDNIRVRSIVGRFLEHSRCYYFHNGGQEEVYCASADWMDRNF